MTPSQDSASLPDPAVLEKYHAIDPELARRVLEQAIEAEGRAAEAARRDLRARDVRSDLLAAALAFASAAYIAAVTALPGLGRPWQGAAAFAGGWLAWLLLAWRKRNSLR